MKLGAQFYSVRQFTQTPEDIHETFRKIKEIGYDVVQLSAIGPIDPAYLAECSAEFALPVTCTHSPITRILNDTDALIRDHKTYGCSVIGCGAMPQEYRNTAAGAREFIASLVEPMKKIEAAGMRFAYHNHNFEFNECTDAPGVRAMDILIEEAPTMNFIFDVYWSNYADIDNRERFKGVDTIKYIEMLGGKRITNIHFKDMAAPAEAGRPGTICACGNGIIDFKPIYDACIRTGIENALVEQDNAADYGDVFAQMKISHDSLRPLFV